jgi:hypothetical protein
MTDEALESLEAAVSFRSLMSIQILLLYHFDWVFTISEICSPRRPKIYLSIYGEF